MYESFTVMSNETCFDKTNTGTNCTQLLNVKSLNI